MEGHRIDAETVKDLVDLLLNKSGRDPTALRKLVSPRLVLSLAFSSADSPIKLGTFSPEDTLTLLQAVKLLGEASRALNLSWKPHFRHVEETSLVASSRAIQQPVSHTRTGVVESWTVQLEWNFVYEAPPVAMHAELATTRKRYKVWKSGLRTVNLVFASSSDGTAPVPPTPAPEPISTTTSTDLVTQGALAEAASNNGLQLVALEYSFATLPPHVAFWSFFGSATPLVIQRRVLKLFEGILLTGLRLALSSWTALAGVVAPQQQAPLPSSRLPDPEAVTAPIQLRHHQRHLEPELQAEPAPTSTTDAIGTRRRWSVASSSGSGGHGTQAASPSFGAPATQSAAAHLHLDRPLAERHLHGSAPGSEVAFTHEPSHAHPPRPHHHHPRQHHHHRHSTDDGSFLTRILSLPRQFLSMLFQILQIIIVDFLALGDVFGKMIEMILTYLQVSTTSTTRIETTKLDEDEAAPEEEAEAPPGSMSSPSTAKQVAFAQPKSSDKPRSSKRYSLPLNPPPSPHLSPIVEASSPPPEEEEASPPLALHDDASQSQSQEHTTPIPSGLVVPQSQPLQLPIPSDADSLALALHDQLAHEAAAQAQAQTQQRHKRRRSEFEFEFEGALPFFEQEEEEQEEEQNEEPKRREPPHVNPRTWMAHDLVAQEAASRARELEHVERMAERFALGGPELGEFVEQQASEEEEEGVAAEQLVAEEEEGPKSPSLSFGPAEARPEIRKTSSAPARSEHIPSPPSSSSASPSVAEAATTRTALLLPPASTTTSSASQQQQQQQQAGGEPSVAIATQLEQQRARFVPSSSSSTTAAAADSEALVADRLGLILYEPDPEPELESTAAQQPPVSRAAAVGARSGVASSFVLQQETGEEEGGGEGDDLPSTSTTPQPPPPPSASASLGPACPPSLATTSATTLTAPQPPVLKTKRSFDPSERGIGIARAFGQGQGQRQGQSPLHTSPGPGASAGAGPEKALSEGEETTTSEPGPGPEAGPDLAEEVKVGQGAHEEEEGDRSIDPPLTSGPASPTASTATIFSVSSSAAAAAEAEEEGEGEGPTSVRMQHELSQSGSFASSQGSPAHLGGGGGGSSQAHQEVLSPGEGGGKKKQKSRKKKKKKKQQQ